ncbi:MAG: M56 family metallopeptidase [Longimicrobiaceae bacterium]
MSAEWMLQALLAGTLLGLGALAAERVAGWLGLPRRPVWAAAMLGSLLLPVLSLWAPGLLPAPGIFPVAAPQLPGFDVGALPLSAIGPASPAGLAAAEGPAWWADLAVLLGLGWLAASLAMLGVVAWTYRRLRTARDEGAAMELDGGEVRVTEHVGPAVVGLLHPTVVVPRWVLDAPAEERRLVLLHEREHVAAGDAWLLFLGTLAVAAMPWSVPLWWQHRRLRAAVETDCDTRVLARGADRRAYGRVLIRTAGCAPGLPLLGPAWGDTPSQLERRIVAMTAKRPSHPLLRSLPLLALAVGVAAAACDIAEKGGDAPPAPASAAVAASPRSIQGARPAADKPVTGRDTIYQALIPLDLSDSKLPPMKAWVGWFPKLPFGLEDYPVVTGLKPGSGAWRGGVRNGDLVIAMDGLDARGTKAIMSLVYQQPGTRYPVRVLRDGVVREFTAELEPLSSRYPTRSGRAGSR